MTGYDIIDEAVVDAPPDLVWNALIAEFRGAATWWVPHNTFTTLTGSPDQVGGQVQVTVHTRGVDHGGLKLRFTAHTRAVKTGQHLEVEYTHGVFRGTSTFTLTPLQGGDRTHLAMHFNGRPHGWLRLLARLADIGHQHSQATIAAFTNLNTTLTHHQPLHHGSTR